MQKNKTLKSRETTSTVFLLAVLTILTFFAYTPPLAQAQTDPGCDPQYFESLQARAWLEAQREIPTLDEEPSESAHPPEHPRGPEEGLPRAQAPCEQFPAMLEDDEDRVDHHCQSVSPDGLLDVEDLDLRIPDAASQLRGQ